MSKNTAAHRELQALFSAYTRVLPPWSFPYVPLLVATVFQCLAWFAGSTLLHSFTLLPRVLVLWLIALGEYTFMSPTMNAGVEVLGMSESYLVMVYTVMTLVVFVGINIWVFKKPFELKYVVAFALVALSVYITHVL